MQSKESHTLNKSSPLSTTLSRCTRMKVIRSLDDTLEAIVEERRKLGDTCVDLVGPGFPMNGASFYET